MTMFKWFKKKSSPTETPEDEGDFSGYFSTHNKSMIGKSRATIVKESIAKTFTKTASDFLPVDASGMSIAMDDQGLQNLKISLANFGQNVPDALLDWYAGQGFIGYQTAAMLSQQWLVNKCCTMPAKDAARRGYDITVNDGTEVKPEVLEAMMQGDKKAKIRMKCVNQVRMGRIFGIRHAMFKIKNSDPDYYAKPFNIDSVTEGTYQGIAQIDPYWITPILSGEAATNPAAEDFYEPTWWMVMGQRVHRTHLVIMKNDEVPDILKPAYLYGGVPVPQRVMERIYAAERTANEAPLLAMSKRLTVLKIDITKAMADPIKFNTKMQAWVAMRDNMGVKVVGKDEAIEQYDTALGDLDDVIMTQYQLVSAAADVPSTKLMGTQPKGFNSNGDYETDSYHEFLESVQEDYMTPLVERHHQCMIRSSIAPKFKIKPFSTEIAWRPIDVPKAEELADINYKKSQTDITYVQAGAVSPEMINKKLINDKFSGYNGMESFSSEPIGDPEGEGTEGGSSK